MMMSTRTKITGKSVSHAPDGAKEVLIAAVVVWSLAWKGASLWRAAKDNSKPWFITLLVSNTVGALDAVYLFGVSAARRRSREG